MSQWWIRDRGREFGPFERDELLAMLASGQVQGYHSCSQDQRNWHAVADMFPPAPPRRRKPDAVAADPPDGRAPAGAGGRSPAPSRFAIIVTALGGLLAAGCILAVFLIVSKNPDVAVSPQPPNDATVQAVNKEPPEGAKRQPSPKPPAFPPSDAQKEDAEASKKIKEEIASLKQEIAEQERALSSLLDDMAKARASIVVWNVVYETGEQGGDRQKTAILVIETSKQALEHMQSQKSVLESKLHANRQRLAKLQ